MKRLYVVFLVVLLLLGLFSCGLRIPEKAPEKVSVKYSRTLEFPITTFEFNVQNFVSDMISSIQNTFSVIKSDPIELTYATSVELSPASILKDVEKEIKKQLDNFSQSFGFKIDVQNFVQNISGTIDLPNLPNEKQTKDVDVSEIPINDITLLQDQRVVIPANSSISIGGILSNLPFDEANFKSAVISLEPFVNGLAIEIDGAAKPFNQSVNNLFIKKSSTVLLKNTTSSLIDVTITIKLSNLKLNYFKNLDVSKVTDTGKIPISIPESNISIANENWQMKLSGNVEQKLIIPGFSGSLKQRLTIKSGTVTLGDQSANDLTLTVPINEVYFKVSDGINVSGSIELSGIVSADFRTQKPKVEITPNFSLKAVKDYQINIPVEKPSTVISIKFSEDSGYMVVDFSGMDIVNAETRFGDNVETGSQVKVNFKNVELPNNIMIKFEANITSSSISYEANVPSDQNIIIKHATVSKSLVEDKKVDINYSVPDMIKNLVNSLKLNVILKIDYELKGVNNLKMNISSNLFDSGTGLQTFSGTGSHNLSSNNKVIDFNSFNSFTLKIEPSVDNDITISNVNLKDGISIDFKPTLQTLEVVEVNLKGTDYKLGKLLDYDFANLFPSDLTFLKEFDYDIEATLRLDIENATIDPSIILDISGDKYTITKSSPANIGDKIEQLLKEGKKLTVEATITTGSGSLQSSSVLRFSVNIKIPFSLKATGKEVVMKEDNMPANLSGLKDVADKIKKAEIRFKKWTNNTGLNVSFKLKKSDNVLLNTSISTDKPTISLNANQINEIISGNVKYVVSVPINNELSLNYNGRLEMVPYLYVELDAPVEVPLK